MVVEEIFVHHSNEHYVLEIDNVEWYHEYKTCLLPLRLNEHLRDDELVDEEKNEEHLFVEIELVDDQKEVQENFLVYLHFPRLMNNTMRMIEQEHHYHVTMELLYEIIRSGIDEVRQVLVILFVNR